MLWVYGDGDVGWCHGKTKSLRAHFSFYFFLTCVLSDFVSVPTWSEVYSI